MKYIRYQTINSLIAGSLLIAMSGANAELVKGDFLSSGDGMLITDTDTGIEWLSPVYTKNLSYEDIIDVGWGELLTTHGFEYSTAETVRNMIDTNFDYPYWSSNRIGDYGDIASHPAAVSFMEIFGIAQAMQCSRGPCPRTQGLVADLNPEKAIYNIHINMGMLNYDTTGYAFEGTGWSPAARSQQLGHWLIRSSVLPNVPPTINEITVGEQVITSNTAITVSTTFADENEGDTHSMTIDWGDGTIETFENVISSVSQMHEYIQAGIYVINMTVADNSGASATTDYEYVVVYDDSAGFVTGGGSIESPLGAYAADTNITGKVSVGFNSKYKKGQSTPSGNIQFNFKSGDIKFHSSNYDWLVVADSKAQFKGEGTINNSGHYGFMLTAVDGQISGGYIDKLRMKIWDKNNGDIVVYDNQMGGSDDDIVTTELTKGSIVIHKK